MTDGESLRRWYLTADIHFILVGLTQLQFRERVPFLLLAKCTLLVTYIILFSFAVPSQ